MKPHPISDKACADLGLSALCVALLVLFVCSLFGCAGCSTTQRLLDPAGAYAGDVVRWQADGAIEDVADACDEIVALADRNPEVVARSPRLQAFVARVRAEQDGVPKPDEVLTQLITAKRAWIAARTRANADSLNAKLDLARGLLTEARAMIPLFFNSP